VQEAALAQVAEAAKAAGAERLVGKYIPSAKNAMVAEHYAKLGFEPAGELPDGGTRWTLDLASYVVPDLPMRIETGSLSSAEANQLA